jgi:hypothetical protein
VTLLKDNGATTNFVHVFEVPDGFVISAQPVLAQVPVAAQLPVLAQLNAASATGISITSNEYITDPMHVPLCYRDETPSCVYEFDFIVDDEHVVAEAHKTNNEFKIRRWFTTPAAVQRSTPFVVESVGSHEAHR